MNKSFVLALIVCWFSVAGVLAQCPNNNTPLINFTPVCNSTPQTVTNCIRGGQYATIAVTAGNSYTFTTCNTGGSSFDTEITLFNNAGGGTSLAYNDDDCGLLSTVTWVAPSTGAIRVLVDAYSGGSHCQSNSTCAVLTVTCGPPPANDEPCGATPLTVGTTCNFSTYTTTGSSGTTAVADPGCANYNGSDIWFSAVVPGTGGIRFETREGGLTDGGMAVYTASNCSTNFTLLGCIDDVNGSTMPEGSFLGLTPGTTVYVRMWEYGGDDNGTFDICAMVDSTVPATNNDPCTATPLTVGTACNPQTVNNYGASNTTSVTAPGCGSYNGADVWYTAVVPPSGILNIQTTEIDLNDGAMALYTAASCNGPFSLISCIDIANGNDMPSASLYTLTPGSTVYIRFWDYDSDDFGRFGICASTAQQMCTSPIPDECSNACDLGSLPSPPPCSSGNTSVGGVLSVRLSNVGATPGNPYSLVGNCANPAADVWYRFTATGNELSLAINSLVSDPLTTPNIGLYNGNSCSGLTPVRCFRGSAGNLSTTTFSPLTAGDVYYLQISGGNVNDVGNFVLTMSNNTTCDDCLLAQDLQVTPPPVNGVYKANQTVDFCFTVLNYNPTSVNWLHGIDLDLGAGWNPASLTPTVIPPSCDTTAGAHWGWYTSVTSTHSGQTFGPGFFYETSAGPSGTVLDNNPGNNYGDQEVSGTACPIRFCWRATTSVNCVNGTPLNIRINTLGDSESGGWTSDACQNDVNPNFAALMSCCDSPAVTRVNPICGQPYGNATAQGNGTGPWNYYWLNSNNDTLQKTTGLNTQDAIDSLVAGLYRVIATDISGCAATSRFQIDSSSTSSLAASNTGPYCPGSTISLNATAGAISYAWSGPAGFTSNQQNTTISGAQPNMAGTYTVTATYTGNCTVTDSTLVLIVTNLSATITATDTALCTGDSAVLVASGATNFTWNTGDTTVSITVKPGTTTSYAVTITDGGGCSAVDSIQITVGQTPALTITPDTAAVCGGVPVTLVAGGASTYLWSTNATNDTITVTPGSPTTYTVTGTNPGGCTATATAFVNASAGFTMGTQVIDVTCNGANDGQIILTTFGGQAPFTYQWSDSSSNQNASGLGPQRYYVTVTDAAGCSASGFDTVSEPGPVSATETHTNATCAGINNGTATITVTSGIPPYRFIWSDGDSLGSRTGMAAGTYDVTVSDSNACTATITGIVIGQATPFLFSETHTNIQCFGMANGTIDVTLNGGSAPFNYTWNDQVYTLNRTGLSANTYSLVVTDYNSCTAGVTVTITEPTALSATETHTNSSCQVAGSIDITTSGGTPPYTFAWSDGDQTEDRAAVNPGSYDLTVTDSAMCTVTVNVVITGTSAVIISAQVTNATCAGINDGAINITPLGNVTPYTYSWLDGNTSASRTGLAPGSYTVTVSDSTGCSADSTFIIGAASADTLTEIHTNASCAGIGDGSIDVTATGNPPYTYLWNDNAVTEDRSGLAPGTYSVTATNTNQCTSSLTVDITGPGGLNFTSNFNNPTCASNPADGTIAIDVSGGTSPYQIKWSTASSADSIANLKPGTYYVTVTDAQGCNIKDTFILSYLYDFTVDASGGATIIPGESATLGYTVFDTGAIPGAFNIVWQPANTLSCANCAQPVATPSVSTLYTVLVTNAAGCTSSDTVSVFVTAQYNIFVPNAFTPNADGTNDFFQLYGNLDFIAYMQIQVFNRWGEKVFESGDHNFKWDGNYKGVPSPPAVYTYQLQLTFLDGLVDKFRTGSFTIIR